MVSSLCIETYTYEKICRRAFLFIIHERSLIITHEMSTSAVRWSSLIVFRNCNMYSLWNFDKEWCCWIVIYEAYFLKMFIIGLDTYAQYLSNTWFFYHEYIGLYKAIDFFGSGNNVNEIQKKKKILDCIRPLLHLTGWMLRYICCSIECASFIRNIL